MKDPQQRQHPLLVLSWLLGASALLTSFGFFAWPQHLGLWERPCRFMCPRVLVILIFLCHGGEGVQNRSELAARCEVLLGEETTTTTTMWFATPSYRRTLELHPILLDAIWKDGSTMAAEFQSWLQVRVIGIFCGIAGCPFWWLLGTDTRKAFAGGSLA